MEENQSSKLAPKIVLWLSRGQESQSGKAQNYNLRVVGSLPSAEGAFPWFGF